MGEGNKSKRGALIRDVLVFQFKLTVDGLRDVVLMPLSLIAAIAGLLRGGDQPDSEFQQVLSLGRQSERWINLFGGDARAADAMASGSIDTLFEKAGATLKRQARRAGGSEGAVAQAEQGAAPGEAGQRGPDQ